MTIFPLDKYRDKQFVRFPESERSPSVLRLIDARVFKNIVLHYGFKYSVIPNNFAYEVLLGESVDRQQWHWLIKQRIGKVFVGGNEQVITYSLVPLFFIELNDACYECWVENDKQTKEREA